MSLLTQKISSQQNPFLLRQEESPSELSPAEKYRQMSEMVEKKLTEKKLSRSFFTCKAKALRKEVFVKKETKMSSIILTVGSITDVFFILQKSTPTVAPACSLPTYRSFPSSDNEQSTSPSPKTRFSPKKENIIAWGSCAAIAFGLFSYKRFQRKITSSIEQAHCNIADESINQRALLNSTNRIMQSKNKSYFNKVFEYFNPNEVSRLHLIKGIALDSMQNFPAAQGQYRTALENGISDINLCNTIYFTLARSIRLSNGNRAEAFNWINRINPLSPVQRLGQIETQAWNMNLDAVFDDDHIPFDLKCPITQEVMNCPAFYVDGLGQSRYFERNAIEIWIEQDGTCPITRHRLNKGNLNSDADLEIAIAIWKRTQLII